MRIGLCGDVMIGRLVNEHLKQNPPDLVWGNTLPLFESVDLRIINLEAALTSCEEAVPKVFNFKSDPSHVATLQAAGIDAVNLANNHVLDYGVEGLVETLEMLDRADIAHVGAGRNGEEACSAVQLGGVTLFGCTDNEPGWKAGEKRSGVHYLSVGELPAVPKGDLVILSIHWGPNMRQRPPGHFRAFAHALIDAGVDVIHGHSAHIFQGVEIYKGRPILYDTGDFLDDYAIDPELRNDQSFFFILEDLHRLRMVPVQISHFQVNQVPGEAICARMDSLCQELGTPCTQKEGELVIEW